MFPNEPKDSDQQPPKPRTWQMNASSTAPSRVSTLPPPPSLICKTAAPAGADILWEERDRVRAKTEARFRPARGLSSGKTYFSFRIPRAISRFPREIFSNFIRPNS